MSNAGRAFHIESSGVFVFALLAEWEEDVIGGSVFFSIDTCFLVQAPVNPLLPKNLPRHGWSAIARFVNPCRQCVSFVRLVQPSACPLLLSANVPLAALARQNTFLPVCVESVPLQNCLFVFKSLSSFCFARVTEWWLLLFLMTIAPCCEKMCARL
jgi:hypothetical protein